MLTQNTCSPDFDQTGSMIWKLELATDIQTEIVTFDKTTFCVQGTPKWKTPTVKRKGAEESTLLSGSRMVIA